MGNSAPKRGKEPWHAVSIVPHGRACPIALTFRGKRFLAAEAPTLPLDGCTALTTCTCVYRHYTDRRAGPRRESEESGLQRTPPANEQRVKRGRREDDKK
jgi:hypothetical protein